MDLFGKNKNEADTLQTNEIKEATQANSSFSNKYPNDNSQSFQDDNLDTNPFADTHSSNIMQQNSFQMGNKQNQINSNNSSGFGITEPQSIDNSQQYTQSNPFSNNMDQQNNSLPDSFTNSIHMNSTPQSSEFSPESSQVSRDELHNIVDETVEKVIEERWGEIVNNVQKVVKWKDHIEQDINMLKNDIVQIKNAFESMEKKIVGKINSYDTNIMDVNSEIKALEKVFQKITPTLINNVNELSKIADKLNKTSGKDDNNQNNKNNSYNNYN